MRKILFLGAVALAVTGCLNTPWVITASSDRQASSDQPARSGRPQAPRGSVLLGEQEVDFKVDRDRIAVRNHEGSFRALYFFVEKNDIELFNLVIDFDRGESQRVETRLLFDENTRSRLIDLDGRQRRIKSIQFTYTTVGTWQEGKARVVVYGVR